MGSATFRLEILRSMSQENVENFKRTVEAWNGDDFDAWIDLFDPEVEWSALTEAFRGHAGARQAWQSFKGDMQLRIRFDDLRDLGESVLALGEITGTGRTTRLNVTREIAQLATFRGGKIVSFRDFPSHAEGLEAAGLPG
jgi:ketosteroid isomerase-like protein